MINFFILKNTIFMKIFIHKSTKYYLTKIKILDFKLKIQVVIVLLKILMHQKLIKIYKKLNFIELENNVNQWD